MIYLKRVIILFALICFALPAQAVVMIGFNEASGGSSVTPIFSDGFESGDISNWSSGTGTYSVDTWSNLGVSAPSNGGTYGIQLSSTAYITKTITGVNEIWITVSFYYTSNSDSLRLFLIKVSGSASQSFQVNTSGNIFAYNYETSAGHTFTQSYSTSSWHTILVHVKQDNTNGEIDIHYDNAGSWTIDGSAWTGIDTQLGASGNIDSFSLGTAATGVTGYFDNVNLYDSDPTSTSPPSTVTAEFSDDFDTGSLSGDWTSSYGVTVDTWANFGISGPTGGGTHGVKIDSAEYMYKDITEATDLWFTTWIRTSTSGNAAPIVFGKYGNGVNSLFLVQFDGSGHIYVRSYPAATGSTSAYSSFSASTWYKIKVHVTVADSGNISIWYDNAGTWTQIVDYDVDLYVNAGCDRIATGTSGTNGTRYIDEWNYYTDDPGSGL